MYITGSESKSSTYRWVDSPKAGTTFRSYPSPINDVYDYQICLLVRLEQGRVKQGDVVCVHDDLMPRQNWKVGVIQKLIPGRDGRVQAAFVRLVSGGKCVELHRPVERLYPIEVPKDNQEGEPNIKFVSDKVKIFQGSG